ncbi:MAG: hypothetical protein HQ582_07610, partial [Planctomycetes bacterium]|nr:hypothetical protein [Planctomycetota bacterium]
MRKPLCWLLVLAVCSPLYAQTAPPALMVKIDNASQPLGLVKMETDVRIFGRLAQTTSTMTFHNRLDRVMEGDLYFPLPEGATVSGYALDVEGRMVDGVAVEKRKGREVFEAIVRQGIDPGLVEWTRGNNFKTRVFPIPARGTRTIRVEYVTELIGGEDEPAYHLPTSFSKRLRDFSLRVEVVKPKAEPKIAGGGLPNFAFEKWRDSFVAETRLRNVMLTEDLVVALPRVDEQNVLVEKGDDGEVYFAVHDFPDPPSEEKKASPKHIVLYWDASGSRAGGDREREIGLVEAYLKSLARAASARDRMIHVDVMLIRNAQSKQKHFVVPAATPEGIIDTLKEIRYDGGTQIAAIAPKPGLPAPDFYMLFTDGISNFGQEEPGALDAPLYVFSADATADHSFLHQLAMTTGGRYFNLKRMADADVVSAIGQPAYGFLSGGGEGAKETCPGLPRPIAGRFTLVGKLDAEEASVRLQYGYQGKPVVKERSFTVSRDDAAKGSLLRRLWAQTKLTDLMTRRKRNEAEIVALGKEHGLVTPFTSLIVLDSLEQYVEYEIAPPKSLPEMREEYMRQVDTLEFQQRKQKADKLGQVVEMWQARVAWWNTVFKYPKDFKYKEPKDEAADPFADRGAGMGGMVPVQSRLAAPDAELPAASMSTPAEGRPAMSSQADFDSLQNLIVETVDPEPWERADEESPDASRRQPGIVIKPWDPETPYMKKLKAAGKDGAMEVYLESRAEYGTSPAFFLDCADHFFQNREPRLALRV